MINKYNSLLLSPLDWNLPEAIQDKAINNILSLTDFDYKSLIQPIDIHHWENAAKVLSALGYNKISHLTKDLLEWVQDVNWPGAFIVLDILKTFPNDFLLPYLENAIMEAKLSNDDPWLEYLSIFTYCGKFSKEEFKSKKLFDILKSHEDQWNV